MDERGKFVGERGLVSFLVILVFLFEVLVSEVRVDVLVLVEFLIECS